MSNDKRHMPTPGGNDPTQPQLRTVLRKFSLEHVENAWLASTPG
jgi:hypothetical protein